MPEQHDDDPVDEPVGPAPKPEGPPDSDEPADEYQPPTGPDGEPVHDAPPDEDPEEPEEDAGPTAQEPPEDLDWENQDFSHLEEKPPEKQQIMGIWCVIADQGDTQTTTEVLGDPTRDQVERFIRRHVVKPDLTGRVETWGTGPLLMWMQRILEHLGLGEEAIQEAKNSYQGERTGS